MNSSFRVGDRIRWCKMWHVGHARHKNVGSTRYNRQSGEAS